MKKMLFIGAMLIVGVTAFGGRGVIIGNSSQEGPFSGDASLGIMTKGEVVDETQNVLLVVKPTISAGDDETSLHFRFGDMKAGTGKDLDGEFTVEVLKEGKPVSMNKNGGESALSVELAGGTTVSDGTVTNGAKAIHTELKSSDSTQKKLGSLRYTLTGKNENNNKLYTGKVVSNVTLDAGANGSFKNDACYLTIKIDSLEAN